MTVRRGLVGAVLDGGMAPVVDGRGCAWLRYRGALPFLWSGRYGCGQVASGAIGRAERQ